MSESLTFRVDSDIKKDLKSIAEHTHRSMAYHLNQGLREYLAREKQQLLDIQAGIDAADQGDFASDGDMQRLFDKYASAE